MEIARHWRLKQQRYRLEGSVCGSCNEVMFPQRKICLSCGEVLAKLHLIEETANGLAKKSDNIIYADAKQAGGVG